MKNRLPFLPFALCLLMFAVPSCKYPTEYQLVNAGNQFTLAVPPWMKEDNSLKQGAVFQYANHFRNFYAIGETLSTGDKTHEQIVQENLAVLRKSMPNAVVSDSTDITAGTVKGTRVEIFGKMTGENIYFSEILYYGNKNIYHISIWTRGENRKLHFKEDIDKIVASFREI